MDLPGRQDELVAAVAAVNPRTVVVLNCGSPVAMPWLDRRRRGAADLVSRWAGRYGPRRRAVRRRRARRTSPGHVPTVARPHTRGALLSGRRRAGGVRRGPARRLSLVRARGGRALVPVRSRARIHDVRHHAGRPVRIAGGRCRTWRPTSSTPADDPAPAVVQVYVDYEGTDPDVPRIRRFVGARKVFLVPGERATVTIELTERMFSSWLDDGWRVAAGTHRVLVGTRRAHCARSGTIDA